MTKVDTISAAGASGQTYSFDVYPWGTSFNSAGAVYMVLKRNGSNYTPIYIGQTSDLSERFDNHHKQSCFDRNGKTHIAIHGVTSESRRFDIETDLVRRYAPTCND